MDHPLSMSIPVYSRLFLIPAYLWKGKILRPSNASAVADFRKIRSLKDARLESHSWKTSAAAATAMRLRMCHGSAIVSTPASRWLIWLAMRKNGLSSPSNFSLP